MTSTAVRPVAESGSSGPTFSYAQAAKGRAASTTTPAVAQSSQNTSGTNTPPKDSNPTTDIQSVSIVGNSEADRGSISNGDTSSRAVSSAPDSDIKSSTIIPLRSSPSSPSIGTAASSTLPKEDEATFTPKLSSDSPWDRPAQQESTVDKFSEANDRKKGKKGKKEKTQEKETEPEREEVKPEVLVAAPPPAVNIWQQRMKAEAAKAKTSPVSLENSQASAEDSNLNGNVMTLTSKAMEPKKKGKPNAEESERPINPVQSASAKEQLTTMKTARKSFDTNVRSKEDLNGKRPAPRGSRMSDKEEKSMTKNLPPPVEDATSWPTPDTALEEKRKAQEKVEKDEKEDVGSNKPRPKEKWVTVPYIPTVTFSTPLPTRGRGGRGGGGARGGSGRGGHATNGSINGEKVFNSSSASTNITSEPRERGRDSVSAGRATSLPPNASKRSAGETPNSPQDQRKPSVSGFEKSRGDVSDLTSRGENYSAKDNRRSSIAAHMEPFSTITQESRQPLNDIVKPSTTGMSNGIATDSLSNPRSAGPDRRTEPNTRTNDFPKDANSHGQPRERGDGRPERGRGNYRATRSNHNNFSNGQSHNQHSYTNGHTSQTQNTYGVRQNTGPYSPPLQQQQFATVYPTPSRGGRGGPARSQSIPTNNNVYPRFPPNVSPSSQQMPPLQTVGPVFDYPGMQTMSAVPYTPYMEPYSVLAMVTMQLEYYFSIDNLCKDVFLRKHMDSKGFVFLSTIANFKRIQALTQDFELLRFACQESEVIDIVIGEDGIDRLRRQDGWEQWVLAMEERDENARNDGPERYYRQQAQIRLPTAQRMIPAPHSAISAPSFSPNGTDANFRPFASALIGTNGIDQVGGYHTDSPLSAAVADFSPNTSPQHPKELEAETTFTDEEVDNLQLVYNHKGSGDIKPKSVSPLASLRTFSNGSIDGRSIGEELQELHKRQGRSLTNGDSNSSELSTDSARRPKSPFAMSPTKLVFGNAPPVMWVKGQKDQAPITESNKNESYNVVRTRALRHRESLGSGEIDGDMKLLYQFWSHFLVRNFNPRMYEEFKTCAVEDTNNRQNMFGMGNLFQYYDEILNSKKKTIPEILAKHYVELVNAEDRSKERPGFAKLRAAWRNGALDMKSRKRIDNFVDPILREELER